MADQNPTNQYPQDVYSPPEAGMTAETPVSDVPPPPPEENLVIQDTGDRIPKWFYLVFTLTLAVFLVISYFLLKSLEQQKQTPGEQGVKPTLGGASISLTVTKVPPTDTPIPTPTIDPAVLKLQKTASSDEITDLESDLSDTDMISIKESLTELDSQMGIK